MRTGISLCLAASACLAQTGSLEGDLVASKFTDLSHLRVRLSSTGRTEAEQSFVTITGNFRFAHLEQGNYTLSVVDEQGNEITREQVEVMPANQELKVELPRLPGAEKPVGAVSVAQLRHKPDRRAAQEWFEARKRSDAGDFPGAAALLEKAVARDPLFAEAHGNLGAQYVRMNQCERAAPEFQKAISLDPSNSTYQSNLALALGKIGRRDEAVQWARRSLALDSTNPLGHYVLGCMLLAAGETARQEAVRHLELAAQSLPAAQTTLDLLRRNRTR